MPGDGPDDNERVLRYLAKVTIEPAITHGLADHVGSLAARPARRHRPLEARLVRRQAGARPEVGRSPAWAPLGEGNATVERAEPTRYRPDWGGAPAAARRLGVTFVAASAHADALVVAGSSAVASVVPIGRTRGLTRADLWLNRATAPIEIDPADGA